MFFSAANEILKQKEKDDKDQIAKEKKEANPFSLLNRLPDSDDEDDDDDDEEDEDDDKEEDTKEEQKDDKAYTTAPVTEEEDPGTSLLHFFLTSAVYS